ncbi:hypothetical protein EfmJHP10_29860 (plasmid) [Enterococcus faecium]|nr:hypothetical protein EfmJHP10_29860 [Enterococcus faecium]
MPIVLILKAFFISSKLEDICICYLNILPFLYFFMLSLAKTSNTCP